MDGKMTATKELEERPDPCRRIDHVHRSFAQSQRRDVMIFGSGSYSESQ